MIVYGGEIFYVAGEGRRRKEEGRGSLGGP
jgi:hypothetical protein